MELTGNGEPNMLYKYFAEKLLGLQDVKIDKLKEIYCLFQMILL